MLQVDVVDMSLFHVLTRRRVGIALAGVFGNLRINNRINHPPLHLSTSSKHTDAPLQATVDLSDVCQSAHWFWRFIRLSEPALGAPSDI